MSDIAQALGRAQDAVRTPHLSQSRLHFRAVLLFRRDTQPDLLRTNWLTIPSFSTT